MILPKSYRLSGEVPRSLFDESMNLAIKIKNFMSTKPDDRPHGHSVDFLRGDGANIPIYDRSIDDTVVYESDVDVVYQQELGSYVWTPKGS